MKKLLRPKDILLLGLAGALDVFEDIQDPAGLGLVDTANLYQWVPRRYKRHNFSRLVARELKTQNIEKIIKNDQVYLRLTTRGKKQVFRDFSLFDISRRRWDRKWRLVIFDIEEVNRQTRDIFRRKLKELGFGMLQESVWISPHDVAQDLQEFVEAKNMTPFVFVLETGEILAGDTEILVNKIWHINDLNQQYSKLLEEINEFFKMYIEIHDRDKKYTDKVLRLRMKYLQVLAGDPCLPEELLPESWLGEKIKKAVNRLPKVTAS